MNTDNVSQTTKVFESLWNVITPHYINCTNPTSIILKESIIIDCAYVKSCVS